MVQIIVSDAGNETTVKTKPGTSLMEALRNAGIEGIVAECGGSLSCATCHVIVDADWISQTGGISDMENDMLDCTAAERQPGSRLSCQIEVREEMDGIRVTIPDNQI
jgi:2Fe-2S ferredoxin